MLFRSELLGVEALVRWNHPNQGLLLPRDFIHMAEMSRFCVPFTFEVINLVCTDIRNMTRLIGRDIPVAVNLPLFVLNDLSFPEKVLSIMTKMGIKSSNFCFELTESSIVKIPAVTLDIVTRLHMRDISFSIDDFGIQNSNLDRLKTMPFSELKLDRKFVSDVVTNATSRAITKTAIDLGHSLGMQIVAEGVEDDETYNCLRDLGCDCVQGFLVSRPVRPDCLIKWFLTTDQYRPNAYVNDLNLLGSSFSKQTKLSLA